MLGQMERDLKETSKTTKEMGSFYYLMLRTVPFDRNSKGKHFYADGSRFEGEWKDDKRTG